MKTPPIRSVAALAVAVALVLGACGGDTDASSDTGVASLGDTESSTSAPGDDADGAAEGSQSGDTPDVTDDPELAFAAYDECMNDAGFEFTSGLAGGESGAEAGLIVGEIEVEAGADPQSGGLGVSEFGEEFEAAEEECRKHLEGLDLSFDMSPEEQAAFEDAQIAWAACMRDQGVDVPDFDSEAGGVVVVEVGDEGDPQGGGFDALDFDVEAFEAANEACGWTFAEFEERFGGENRS